MSKETQERNRSLLTYIRKGLSIQEDFTFCVEGYQSLLQKTEKILKYQNSLDLSDEYLKYIVKEAQRVNDKIKNWEEKIDEKINSDKYLAIYFFKWLGIEYICSLENLNIRLYYKNRYIKANKVLHAIGQYIAKVKQVEKATNNAREILINENMGVIHQQAFKVAGDRKDIIDDLISVAYYQFIQCMDRTFDFSKGTEFSTYVSTCMFHKCREAKIKHDEIIDIPTARMKDKTKSAKGILDLSAKDIENDEERAKEVMIRNTISNSSMYWSLDRQAEDSEDNGVNDHFLSDGNKMKETSDNVMVSDVVQKIINKILDSDVSRGQKKIVKIKALEYSGALDFDNEMGGQTLKSVAKKLYDDGYTETEVTVERARQLINDGKELIKRQILREPEFLLTLGLAKEA